jgi:hypothetical protein
MTVRPSDRKTPKIQPYDRSEANTSEKRQTGRVPRQFGHARSFLLKMPLYDASAGHNTQTKVTTPQMPNPVASVRSEHGYSVKIYHRTMDSSPTSLPWQFGRKYARRKVGNIHAHKCFLLNNMTPDLTTWGTTKPPELN